MLQQRATDEVLSQLIAESKRYGPLLDPTFFLLILLDRAGFENHMDRLVPELESYRPELSITNGVYYELLLQNDPSGYAPWSNFKKVAEYYREHSSLLPDVAKWAWLSALAVNEDGLLSSDPAVHRDVLAKGKELLQQQSPSNNANLLLANSLVWSAMAAGDDRLYRAALNSSGLTKRILMDVSISKEESLEISTDLGVPVDNARRGLGAAWERLLSCKKYDMANRLLELYGDKADIVFDAAPEDRLRLAPLDEQDPLSVARHAAVAYLNYDRERLQQLSFDALPGLREMQEVNVAGMARTWFINPHMLRSTGLHESLIALIPATVTDVHPLCAWVFFDGPYGWLNRYDDGSEVARIYKLVRLDETAPWRMEQGSPFDRWLQLIEAGKSELVTLELERIFRKSTGFMGLFLQQPTPPHEQLWQRVHKDVPYRTELVVRTWAATTAGNVKVLDDWLEQQQLSLKPAQAKAIQEARLNCWSKSRDYQRMVPALLAELSPSSPVSQLVRLLPLLEHDKRDGGALWQQPPVADLLNAMLDNDQLPARNKATILFIRGEDAKAWELLLSKLHVPGELQPQELDELANTYLWRRLMSTKDPGEIAEAYALSKSKLSSKAMQDGNLAHTFACAAAQIGKMLEALDYLMQHGTRKPHDELLRGLILKQCGFEQVADEIFRKLVDEKVGTGNDVIAELHL